MTTNQTTLTAHFERIADRTEELDKSFYALLDERHPEVLNSVELGSTQRTQMLNQILAAVHDTLHVDDTEWVAAQLGALGRAHVRWNVKTNMYQHVCECLVDALAILPDSGWSEELKVLWTNKLMHISVMMHGPAKA
jgi:hemoglobin-like flavoprotein